MQNTRILEKQTAPLPLLDEGDEEDDLDIEDLLKLGDEDAIQPPHT